MSMKLEVGKPNDPCSGHGTDLQVSCLVSLDKPISYRGGRLMFTCESSLKKSRRNSLEFCRSSHFQDGCSSKPGQQNQPWTWNS